MNLYCEGAPTPKKLKLDDKAPTIHCGDSIYEEGNDDLLCSVLDSIGDEWRLQKVDTVPPVAEIVDDSKIDPAMDGTVKRFDLCARKKVNQYSFKGRNIVFQQIEIIQKSFYFLVFGVTDDGVSICCRVLGFKPYFYYSLPKSFRGEVNLNILRTQLNESISLNSSNNNNNAKECIDNIEIVQKKNIMYYNNQTDTNYLKLTFANTYNMKMFEQYAQVYTKILNFNALEKFEHKIDFTIRFMCDLNIVGCSWLELPSEHWRTLDTNQYLNANTKSTCQFNVSINYDKIIVHAPNDLWARIAPLRILSFDIECAGRRGIFPEPSIDPVIQIANVVYLQGNDEPFIRNVFVLNSCAPIDGQDLLCFDNEHTLLERWQQFVQSVDPDLLTGYNIMNFDLPYLLRRADALGVVSFSFLGRMVGEHTTIVERDSFSKQTGHRKLTFMNISGRVIFDLFPIILREHKLRSSSLNAVSFHFLNEKKEDVHHSIITDLHNESSIARRRLAVYCAKDAYLPVKLLNKLMCVINYIEMARVTGVPLSYLIVRGQQVKVFSQLLRAAQKRNLIIPSIIESCNKNNAPFEGATVIEPDRGFHSDPIATLDFASLYPSIMIAYNLCYTTLVSPSPKLPQNLNLSPDDTNITPNLNHSFVKPTIMKGVLPEILENLLEARKIAKRDLKNETDPQKKKVLDGRQLALKVSANSVYGFTGAQMGKLPCLAISASVTAYGRSMIEFTKNFVQKHYEGSHVIYGDTDSIMVNFGKIERSKAMDLGKEAADLISKQFISPIKLEFEKVYHPYLLIQKKRYAGLLFTKPDKHDKLDCKGKCECVCVFFRLLISMIVGIETVRRDNAPIVATLIKDSLETLLIKNDSNAAVEHVKDVIRKLMKGDIDISSLIITKELAKAKYASTQPHAELALKLAKRDPGSAPKLGDRVSFVICAGDKKELASKRAEDPIYALENSIPIDKNYYLHNQIAKPVLRIFSAILGGEAKAKKILLTGRHMDNKNTSISKNSPLSKFIIIRPSCIRCKVSLSGCNSKVFCDKCLVNGQIIRDEECTKLNNAKSKRDELWDECRRCQGSDDLAVICTNRDCNIYFSRQKIKYDVEEQEKIVKRFEALDW